ncbi:MAG: hypothetical protein JNK04_14735, partial [Myxococcales bacterium]|nr:hypothetical protein [Myxococcales bacterium]
GMAKQAVIPKPGDKPTAADAAGPTEPEPEEIEAEPDPIEETWDYQPADLLPDDAPLRLSDDQRETEVKAEVAPKHAIDDESTEITKGPDAGTPAPAQHPSQRPATPGSYSSTTASFERLRPKSSLNIPTSAANAVVDVRSAATSSPGPSAVAAATKASERPPSLATSNSMATVAETKTGRTEPPPPSANASPLDKDLRSRAERLRKEDPVAAARAHIELGLLSEWVLFDRGRARKSYESSHELVKALQPSLTRLRRLGSQSPNATPHDNAREVLAVLSHEIDLAETDDLRADLFAARARAQETVGKHADARASYAEALKFVARHPASLHGLEAALRNQITDDPKGLHAELAEHLSRVAEVYMPDGTDGDAGLGAWVSVERSEILERQLKDIPAAREALKRAVALAPNPGPVRSALVRHLSRHDRDAGLAEALRVEAEREADADRAARLLYSSARISLDRSNARGDGIASLTRAEHRAPHGSLTQERIFTELIHQLEIDGDHTKLVELRVKRLGLLSKREVIAHEYVRLADAYGRLGRADLSADAAARALSQDPANRGVREALDQSLQRLGKHADRVRTWLLDANADRPLRDRIRAFLRAADIAARHLG